MYVSSFVFVVVGWLFWGFFCFGFFFNLIHFLFNVATGTAIAVSMSFTYAHMYITLLYSACFNRRDGSSAGKDRGLTRAGGIPS